MIPQIVFIVPYRNRPQHKFFFSKYMTLMLDETPAIPYEIYFAHQDDHRSFNRGAVKNIGFLAMKQKYPTAYATMTFVFNDIDTVPFSPGSTLFPWMTSSKTVKHFYGFEYALGGIVSIVGQDFEDLNGFPNYWGWGMEDRVLQQRCEKQGIRIDRQHFHSIGSPMILHLFDGISRFINRKDSDRAGQDTGIDGLKTIHKLVMHIDRQSTNVDDNVYVVDHPCLFVVNIQQFRTLVPFESQPLTKYDLRQPISTCLLPSSSSSSSSSPLKVNPVETTQEWSNIPFYPTSVQKQEMVKQFGSKETSHLIDYQLLHSTRPYQFVSPTPSPSSSPSPSPNRQVKQWIQKNQWKAPTLTPTMTPPGANILRLGGVRKR